MSSGPPSKFALETFLTGVTSQVANRAAKLGGMLESSSDAAAPSQDSEVAEAWRSVVLTILDQYGRAMGEQDLLARSELSTDKFQQIMRQLLGGGEVAESEDGYKLTEAGHEEAEKRRSRLLRIRR